MLRFQHEAKTYDGVSDISTSSALSTRFSKMLTTYIQKTRISCNIEKNYYIQVSRLQRQNYYGGSSAARKENLQILAHREL